LEDEGVIQKLHPTLYSTTGVATTIEYSQQIGKGIAKELKDAGVNAVILTSTWGTSTRCGATLAKEIEREGIPVAHITSLPNIAAMANSNRIVQANGIVHPVGDASLSPEEEKEVRWTIVQKALEALQTNLDTQRLFK